MVSKKKNNAQMGGTKQKHVVAYSMNGYTDIFVNHMGTEMLVLFVLIVNKTPCVWTHLCIKIKQCYILQ